MRDFLVKIALKLGLYKQIVECINRAKFEIQARRMRKDGLEMLDAANRVFATMNVRAFLTYGALLGAYRDKGFILKNQRLTAMVSLFYLIKASPRNPHGTSLQVLPASSRLPQDGRRRI